MEVDYEREKLVRKGWDSACLQPVLPNLPGFIGQRPRYRSTYNKKHLLDVKNGLRVEKEDIVVGKKRTPRASLDRKNYNDGVLSFLAYLREEGEDDRKRWVTLEYFLSDSTISICEQGTFANESVFKAFINRQKVPLDLRDMVVDEQVSLFERLYTITECDDFTRDYFKDVFKFTQPERKTSDPQLSRAVNTRRSREKKYREVMYGGGHVNLNMQSFMVNDGKVCRFYAVMDDHRGSNAERRPFIILYFLTDHTMEVREVYTINCGRDPFPIYMSRCTSRSSLESLQVGENLRLIGDEEVLLVDADVFTRMYFRECLGKELNEAIDLGTQNKVPEMLKVEPPAHNGFGSEEDSMASCLHLVPKPPRKNVSKLFTNEGKQLQFEAQLLGSEDRRFQITYQLWNDTVSINEIRIRNSGYQGGRFLEAGKYLNTLTGENFKANDFKLGGQVTILGNTFSINGADKYTQQILQAEAGSDGPDEWPGTPQAVVSASYSNLTSVLERYRRALQEQQQLVRDAFRLVDTNHDGYISWLEFSESLKKHGFQLTQLDALTLMTVFDGDLDGQISYSEFCDVILEPDVTANDSFGHTSQRNLDDAYQAFAEEKLTMYNYYQRCLKQEDQKKADQEIRACVLQCTQFLYAKSGAVQKLMIELGKVATGGDALDKNQKRFVSLEQIQSAFLRLGQVISLREVGFVVDCLFPENTNQEKIDYVAWLNGLKAMYNEVAGRYY